MKIVFITATMGGGGSERVIAELANQYIKWNHQVEIIMTAGEETAYYLDPKVKAICLGGQTQGNIWKRIKRLSLLRKRMLASEDTLFISFGTETNLYCILASMGKRIPLLLSERNDPGHCTYPMIRNLLYSFGKKFVFQTPDARACFSNSVQQNSIVIPNPITRNIPIFDVTEREKKIVTVGRLTPQKNHRLMLAAFSKFHKEYSDYELVFYGQGELEQELKQYVEELQLQENVIFAGFHKDVLNQIKNVSMYVLSSDYEGISNSLLEALAIGLPVISTDCPIGGSKMCIQNGVNGLLVPVGDVEALSEAMIKIVENPDWAERMGREATKVRERFSVENIARKWLEFGVNK